ncbi:hypothetical protein [Croceimicrobium hydrocarbonivorans]|uniref:Uncharacterized protein n=1 Tax=Croceimicrobium hydrocarbonivorans TaxID=2761580 RepID=A0A7H0VDW2_9FLAO|nr:hypothetical protein [Croceimicrobium hydrocarbonivorans]QNR23910.1 hypothetical protein H4K34_16260 [Croceimicrobium hydrocarbonivorans]
MPQLKSLYNLLLICSGISFLYWLFSNPSYPYAVIIGLYAFILGIIGLFIDLILSGLKSKNNIFLKIIAVFIQLIILSIIIPTFFFTRYKSSDLQKKWQAHKWIERIEAFQKKEGRLPTSTSDLTGLLYCKEEKDLINFSYDSNSVYIDTVNQYYYLNYWSSSWIEKRYSSNTKQWEETNWD